MGSATAKELLLLHSFSHPEAAEHPRARRGFLGSLRPYTGSPDPDNFREVMDALIVLAPELQKADSVDLIAEEDVQRIERWVETISCATMTLLDGGCVDEAFDEYRRHGAG